MRRWNNCSHNGREKRETDRDYWKRKKSNELDMHINPCDLPAKSCSVKNIGTFSFQFHEANANLNDIHEDRFGI